MQVLVGLVGDAEHLADRLRGLLRAAVRAGEDRLDPLALQALPEPAGLLPAALGEAVAVLRRDFQLRSATLLTDSPWRVK